MSFAIDVTKFAVKAKGRMDIVRGKIVMDLFGMVIQKTPVDKGRARGNWQASTGAPITSAIENPGTSPSSDSPPSADEAAAIEAAIRELKGDESIFIMNNVAYILRLENGWSDQAPSGMVKTTLRAYPGIVEDAVNEVNK